MLANFGISEEVRNVKVEVCRQVHTVFIIARDLEGCQRGFRNGKGAQGVRVNSRSLRLRRRAKGGVQ